MKDWSKEMAYHRMIERENRDFDNAEHRIKPFLWAIGLCVASLILSGNADAADARLMLNIIACESGMNSQAKGDDGVSRGIAQFRKETFYEFAALAKKQGKWDSKKLGKPQWMNPQQQLFLLEFGIDNGYGARWTCWRKLKGMK